MKRTLYLAAIICAASSMPSTQAAEKCVVPKDWGRFVTAYYQGDMVHKDVLVFEASDGTIRRTFGDCRGVAKPVWEVVRE